MERQGFVYLLMNKFNTVIYVGVTSDLKARIYALKEKLVKGFTARYHVNKLVYFESVDNIQSAITREKQIKAGSRKKKLALIQSLNPDFKDLYDSI
ncbi:MAG: excinuclease ABC subunit C [Candidatus Omnitrophica bacterium CG11_big_fil_rev_8_21_14_0_20_45_26]|uniref:Excinuclease ABC subunit C n=1 Tax=Candidatus Abzuiibacterium crystallinum TaxID=1974748 RepID=A0A2H0LSV7_9BACT|nr:MAG: excinuclease ABC subunit C [Candidatus Omnitrophica bacterium CG11_big_fil_rev_8_21_14_0_20_45_26]PIW64859.1 MAG: excinuclease ABC subunit C [Candidatus Omnitrophica bacterium CG12_big_fil_rev_8_21_14_0_65_45_16]